MRVDWIDEVGEWLSRWLGLVLEGHWVDLLDLRAPLILLILWGFLMVLGLVVAVMVTSTLC